MARTYQLAASLICGSPLTLAADLAALRKGGMDAIHFDVMDGVFVPRFGLYPELLASVKAVSPLPIGAHLMIEEPERFVGAFAQAGADTVVVHAESTRHLDRVVRLIKSSGARAGVALNPATPLSVLDYVLEDIDLIMIMAINPGIVGHKLIPTAIQKIADTRAKIVAHTHIKIEVDGGVSAQSAAQMILAGADILVCGTSSVFKKGEDLAKSSRAFRSHVDAQLKKRV